MHNTEEVAVPQALYTIDEAADALRYSRETVYRWIQSGRLYAVKPGGPTGDWRIPAQAIDDLIAASPANTTPTA